MISSISNLTLGETERVYVQTREIFSNLFSFKLNSTAKGRTLGDGATDQTKVPEARRQEEGEGREGP